MQRDWGDRTNRKHARLKYTIEDRGLDCLPRRGRAAHRQAARSRAPVPFDSTGDRYGWVEARTARRISRSSSRTAASSDIPGRAALLTGLRRIAEVHDGEFRLTANQNVIVANVRPENARAIEALVASTA